MPTTPIDAAAVITLAGAAGMPLADANMAARIAAGAQSAVDAVRLSVRETLFDVEPADYLPTLEELAEPEANTAGQANPAQGRP